MGRQCGGFGYEQEVVEGGPDSVAATSCPPQYLKSPQKQRSFHPYCAVIYSSIREYGISLDLFEINAEVFWV